MLTIFARSVLLYIVSLLAMRAMGKREVGQLQPFELVVVIMIAELAATPMGGVGIPLLYGILPMIALVVCHGIITALCMRSQRFRVWMCGQPTVLMRNGGIGEKQMRKSAMDLNDLMEAIRTAGILDPAEVGTVVLEPGGQADAATSDGRVRLDALFRARLRCTVLEHGVEWPHLPESPTPAGASPVPGGDRQRELLVLVASCGAGLAAAVAVGRLAGPLIGVLVGVIVAVTLALVRRRMLAGARRERDRAAGAAQLRRQWGAVATEVVSRLRVPTVADAVVAETAGTAGVTR